MEPTSNDLKNEAAATGQYVGDKAKHMAKQVSNKVEDTFEQGQARAEDMYNSMRVNAQHALESSSEFVKKYPISTVAGAAAIGLIAGMILRSGTKH